MSIVVANRALTAAAQVAMVQVADDCTVSVQMVATSLVGHNAIFEVSNNGVDWVQILGARTNSGTVCESTTGVLAATPVYGWEFGVAAWTYFQVRCTAHTSGTATYIISSSELAVEPCTSTATSVTVSGPVTANQGTLVAPTPIGILSAASANATSVKASAGTLYQINASNTGAAAAYLKLYNKASAPTVGTDIPVLIIPIPAGGMAAPDLGAIGHRFATGIALAITGAMAYTDTTAVAANQVAVVGSYI